MRVNIPVDAGVYFPASVPLMTPPGNDITQKIIGVVGLYRERDGSVMGVVDIDDAVYRHMDNDKTHSISLAIRQRPIVDVAEIVMLPVDPIDDAPVFIETEDGGQELQIPLVDIGRIRFRRELFEPEDVDFDRIAAVLQRDQFANRAWSWTIEHNDTEIVMSWRAKNEGTI